MTVMYITQRTYQGLGNEVMTMPRVKEPVNMCKFTGLDAQQLHITISYQDPRHVSSDGHSL